MPMFYFKLRCDGQTVEDPTGMDLANTMTAYSHAAQVAYELNRNNEHAAACWQIDVLDAASRLLCRVPFAAVDRTLDGVSDPTRHLLMEARRLRGNLAEAISNARHMVRQARAVVARSQGKPYLVAVHGRDLRVG